MVVLRVSPGPRSMAWSEVRLASKVNAFSSDRYRQIVTKANAQEAFIRAQTTNFLTRKSWAQEPSLRELELLTTSQLQWNQNKRSLPHY